MRTYEDISIMILRNDVAGLIKATKDPDETIREQAVKALRLIKTPEVTQVLTEALNDPSDKVRRAAQFACSTKSKPQPRSTGPVVAVELEVEEETQPKKERRGLWIVLGSWGIASLLLAVLLLFYLFSEGNFGNSGQIFGIFALLFGGGILLFVSVRKLNKL